MKELSIEEKARAYDRVIESGKSLLSDNEIGNAWIYKLLPELKESEDERIREALINGFNKLHKNAVWYNGITNGQILTWLEKQGEHANFRNKIQVGDKVTRNEDGVLVNLSQLNRVAKKDEKQGEQKPMPMFKVGDTIVAKDGTSIEKEPFHIDKIEDDCYWDGENTILVCNQDEFELVEQKSADKVEPKPYFYCKYGGTMPLCSDCKRNHSNSSFKTEEITTWFSPQKGTKQCIDFIQQEYSVAKLTDKVEPKFHEGDWVIDKQDIVHQIANVIENVTYHTYGYDIVGGGYFNDNTEGVRLWTIQDAKYGDVLSYRDGQWCFIYKGIVTEDTFKYYALLSEKGITVNDAAFSLLSSCITPATKEQRDLLFRKMKDAGYEWDAEKKELRKIENEIEIPFGAKDSELQEATYYIPKGFYAEIEGNNVIIKKGEQNTAWSEEDENVKQSIINILTRQGFQTQVNWFKDRIQSQPKQEWNEEDETNASYICAALDCYLRLREERNNTNGQEDLDKARNWLYNKLKSLKERYAWSPSDEQIEALDCVINVGLIAFEDEAILKELLEQLKKLKK